MSPMTFYIDLIKHQEKTIEKNKNAHIKTIVKHLNTTSSILISRKFKNNDELIGGQLYLVKLSNGFMKY